MKQKNNLIKLFLLGLFLGLFFNASVSQAAINGQINYQGKLTDDSNVAVADGNYDMTISIYDAASGGNCVWTARGTCGTPTARSVAVLNGIFSIMLGDTDAGDNTLTGLNFNAPYYLGVKVGLDTEMTPRKSIGASGYAFNSSMLNGLSDATSGANAHILATDSSGNVTVSGNTYFNGVTYYVNSSGTGNLNGLTLAGDMAVNGGDITSTGALTVTPGAGTNFNVVLSGSGDFAVNTNQFYVDTSTARIGIGNSSPSVALHIGATAPTNLGSTADSLMVSGALEVAGAAYLGPMEFPTNSGAISWIDMPVSASATPNAVESYTARIGGTDILTIYGQALGSGAGGIINPRVGIGTTVPTTNLNIEGLGVSLGGVNSQFEIRDTTAIASGIGGAITLSGNYTGTSFARFGAIKGIKENATDNDYASALTFYTRINGATLAERLRINSIGNVGIGITNPTAKLHMNAPVASAVTNPEQFRIEDGTTGGYFSIAEWGSGASIYLPSFNFQSVGVNGVGGGFNGSIPVVNDVNASTLGAIILEGKRVGGAALTAANILNVRNNGTSVMVVDSGGKLGIGTTSPTAYLHIKAGTATASTAPLKFTAGTNLTTAEAGAMEWDGTNLYITQTSGPTRKTIAYTDSALTGTFDGINLATGTQGGIGYFSSTTQLSSSALGTTGQALISGGTGAPTWFAPTAGSLLFAGTGGILAQDNTNLFWDNTSKRLGIGTASPATNLHLSDGNAVSSNLISSDKLMSSAYNTSSGISIVVADPDTAYSRGVFKGVRSRGTLASPLVPSLDDDVLSFLGSIYDGVTTQGTAMVGFNVDGAVSSGVAPQRISFLTSTTDGAGRLERLTIKADGKVGIGTTSPSAQLHTTGAVRFESFGAGTLVTDASGNLSVSSDERLKNIDGNFTRGIDELMRIDPISFHWKENSGMDMENYYVGFSAQNIQDNIPEAVGTDHRGFLTLSDRPILATVVNSIKGQQGQIAGISQNVSELSNVNQDLILKTDENISTVSELQDLLSENLGKIINQVDLQNQSLESLQTQTNEHGSKIKSIEDMLVILQNKMDDFQEISNQELILAQIDLNRTDIDYIKMILGLDQVGNAGDIKMGGQLEAQGIVAGAFGIKITDEKNKTIGTVTIKAGDKSVSVKTEIVSEDSKIFVTPDQPVGVGVSSIKNGESFEIETNIPAEKDLKIDWWIIEEK